MCGPFPPLSKVRRYIECVLQGQGSYMEAGIWSAFFFSIRTLIRTFDPLSTTAQHHSTQISVLWVFGRSGAEGSPSGSHVGQEQGLGDMSCICVCVCVCTCRLSNASAILVCDYQAQARAGRATWSVRTTPTTIVPPGASRLKNTAA